MRNFLGLWLTLIGVGFLAQTLIHAAVSGQSDTDVGYFPVSTHMFRGGAISPTLILYCGVAALVTGAILLYLGWTSGSQSRASFQPPITDEMRSSEWYVYVQDEVQGPYSFQQIHEWIQEKSLMPDDLVRMGLEDPYYEVSTWATLFFGTSDAASEPEGRLTRRETYLRAARAQRRLIAMFLLSLPLYIAAPFLGYLGNPPVSLAGELLWLTVTAGFAYCACELAVSIGYSRLPWVALFLWTGCTPGVPLFIVILINRLATQYFRKANISAGFFGPSEEDVHRAA
jgi:hypothetical protein